MKTKLLIFTLFLIAGFIVFVVVVTANACGKGCVPPPPPVVVPPPPPPTPTPSPQPTPTPLPVPPPVVLPQIPAGAGGGTSGFNTIACIWLPSHQLCAGGPDYLPLEIDEGNLIQEIYRLTQQINQLEIQLMMLEC